MKTQKNRCMRISCGQLFCVWEEEEKAWIESERDEDGGEFEEWLYTKYDYTHSRVHGL